MSSPYTQAELRVLWHRRTGVGAGLGFASEGVVAVEPGDERAGGECGDGQEARGYEEG